MDYNYAKNEHLENGYSSTSTKYKEFRLFLNAVESFNNIVDYFYFENESELAGRYSKVEQFKEAVHKECSELKELANIANAYKHCVRSHRGVKKNNLPWAKDIQRPSLNISVTIDDTTIQKIDVEYIFNWPIPEDEEKLRKAYDFWITSDSSALINV